LYLREKAFTKFSKFKIDTNIKPFSNLENRLLNSGNYSHKDNSRNIKIYGYSTDNIGLGDI